MTLSSGFRPPNDQHRKSSCCRTQAPLTVANAAVAALKDYVVGTAAALDLVTAALPARKPRAERYASRVRLSTSSGSFVLTVAMPLDEGRVDRDREAGQAAMDEVIEIPTPPFGRQVTDRMRSVAQAAVALAAKVHEGDDDVTAFEADPVATGNATELEALAHLGGGLAGDYRIRFTQSPVAPRSAAPTLLTVQPREQEVLAQAAVLLREQQEQDDITVSGAVVGLARDAGVGPGGVVVKGVEARSGTTHRYRVVLSEDDYHEALMAHDRGLQVSVRGSLVVRGNFLRIEGVRFFTVQQELPQEPT